MILFRKKNTAENKIFNVLLLMFFIYIIYTTWPIISSNITNAKSVVDGSKRYFVDHIDVAEDVVDLCRTTDGREKTVNFFCGWRGAADPEKCNDAARSGFGVELCRNAAAALNRNEGGW